MCGIAGKFRFDEKPVKEAEIFSMLKAIEHRGPDDSGIFVNGRIGLGHQRLSVIDLSARGHQPMWDSHKRFAIVYNGEIYNYKELKKELEKEAVFYSETDTEVVLYLFKKHGPDCVKRLRGMFAFAVWDREKQELFLARDRLGKKPLKYYIDGRTLLFASELKAILTQKEAKKEIDWSAVDDYLALKYVPGTKTGFKRIRKLPPACWAIVKKNGEAKIQKYWELDYSPGKNTSESEWMEKIENKLKESVECRMEADVSLGAMLSGGIDSGLIVAIMSQLSSKPVKTFNIAFREKDYDESHYARLVAKQYQTEHQEITLRPKGLEILPILAKYYEEPYADASAIPSYYLSGLTRRHVTVALSGDGGDENFAGYERYLAASYYDALKNLPGKKILSLIARQGYNIFKIKALEKASRQLGAGYSSLPNFYLDIISYFKHREKLELYCPKLREAIFDRPPEHEGPEYVFPQIKDPEDGGAYSRVNRAYFEKYGHLPLANRLLAVSNLTHLPGDLLVKTDIASMAHSLEIRSPMLDHEFMELCASLPPEYKLKGREKKYLLKRIAARYLPDKCVNRPKKGFTVPLGYWFKGNFGDYLASEILARDFLDYGFNKDYIKKMIARHGSGRCNCENQLYALLMLKLWLKEYFG